MGAGEAVSLLSFEHASIRPRALVQRCCGLEDLVAGVLCQRQGAGRALPTIATCVMGVGMSGVAMIGGLLVAPDGQCTGAKLHNPIVHHHSAIEQCRSTP